MQSEEQAKPKRKFFEIKPSVQNYRHVKNKKIDFLSLYVPMYQVSQLKVPIAIIIDGRRLFIRKMPKKRNYFIDLDLGLFHKDPSRVFFLEKTEVYFYDLRNQNPIHPGLLAELYKWANLNRLYKIRRVDIHHAKQLRNENLESLEEQQRRSKLEQRAFINKVQSEIEKKNDSMKQEQLQETGLVEESQEYKPISEHDANFIIVENLFNHGYIDKDMKALLDHKLTTKEITDADDLIQDLQKHHDVLVSEPLPHELERILDEFHTYSPKDVLFIIKELSKIYKGFKNLRTKPIVNWFPATYLLFGALGVAIIFMMYQNYGGSFDLGSIFSP